MNIVNLDVKIHKVRIKTPENHGICFSLRLGRILSSLSSTLANVPNKEVQANVSLTIGCEEGMLTSNSRASLVIYEVNSDKKREIIGMVFIMLKNQQNQITKYKVQQSTDLSACLELSFSITALELKEKENESMASRSSLAEIRELHRALTRGHKKTASDFSYQGEEAKKSRMSPQDKQRELKHRNCNKTEHLKSEQCQSNANQDPSYAIILKKIQNQLAKQKEKNQILTNLLVIEQEKNTQSEALIKRIVDTLTEIQPQNGHYSSLNHQARSNQEQEQPQRNYSGTNIQQVIKERDELYTISQELYNKTKSYKTENQQLYRSVQSLESQMKDYIQEVNDLRQQNSELKKEIFRLSDRKQNEKGGLNSSQLKVQIQRLKKQNTEAERKFKESYRALEEFKNDAWKAQQQVIKKDQQIASLQQELEQVKMQRPAQGSENNESRYISEQKQGQKKIKEALKAMSALIIKNSLQRAKTLQKLEKTKQGPNRDEAIMMLDKVKDSMDRIYTRLEKEGKKVIGVTEVRRKMAEALNSINF